MARITRGRYPLFIPSVPISQFDAITSHCYAVGPNMLGQLAPYLQQKAFRCKCRRRRCGEKWVTAGTYWPTIANECKTCLLYARTKGKQNQINASAMCSYKHTLINANSYLFH